MRIVRLKLFLLVCVIFPEEYQCKANEVREAQGYHQLLVPINQERPNIWAV